MLQRIYGKILWGFQQKIMKIVLLYSVTTKPRSFFNIGNLQNYNLFVNVLFGSVRLSALGVTT